MKPSPPCSLPAAPNWVSWILTAITSLLFGWPKMLGLDDIVPVYVERKWKGDTGSLSWWLPIKMDEKERVAQHIVVPDPDAWNNQMYKVRVLDQLVYDSDPNLTNVLITDDWKIWRIDFTRAFRLHKELQGVSDLARFDRQLFEKLKALNQDELMEDQALPQ